MTQTLGSGVAADVETAIKGAAAHLESLGAVVEEVSGECAPTPLLLLRAGECAGSFADGHGH